MVLKSRAKGKAAGPQGIAYVWIAKLDEREKSQLTEIMNRCLAEETTPLKWKKALINPIPKGKEKSGNLGKLRSIALLEAPRKLFMKILNDRMVKILIKNHTLSNLNWAGLPGGSMRNPINILNKCIEIAKEERKELWITFQDMRKAFDSISKIGMEKALER